MIKLPKGTPIHKELSSSFVDLGKLLEELRNNGFSGLVEMVGLRAEGNLLIENGVIIDLHFTGEKEIHGRQHMNAVHKMAKADNMLISTYQIPPESVVLLSGFLGSEKIHENLSSEFTDPDKLISKFAKEGGEYFIEVLFRKNLGTGLLFIQEGEVVDALLSLLGKSLSKGQAAVTGIIEGASELGAVFNVYKAEIDTGQLGAAGLAIPTDQLEDMIGIVIGGFHENVREIAPKKVNYDLFFREACLTLAEKYPFLDPFAAEFVYKDGHVTLVPGEAPEAIAGGAVALIRYMIEKLGEIGIDFPADEFVAATSQTLEEKHGEASSSLGLSQMLNSLK
ncbi:MAG: hypothetical protein JXQ27_18335 [Acidobacteria bacterium]|nr:hypothetical protein [Acidobacteriota bacterium]